tara:strand:- start:556 stop:1086 length:531 start_codon:yes stop_codon:yes gene_type:complete
MPLTKLNFPSGSILQTQYTQVTTASQVTGISANTQTTVTGLAVNITPSFSNSIIKIQSTLFCEYSASYWTANTMFYFLRDSTALKADTAGSRRTGIATPVDAYTDQNAASTPEVVDCIYFDSGHNTTSQITYSLAFDGYYPTSGTGILYINRTVSDTDNNSHERGVSFIMAQEIKA